MEPVDTLVCARWVLPVEPDGQVLADHAVAMRGGKIVAVLPAAEAQRQFDPDDCIDRANHVLLPGLVNTHTHAAMSLLRGRAENLPFDAWLRDRILPLERRWVDPEYVRDGTELAIAEMLRGGITCFGDMHAWPNVVAQAAAEMHMRASVGLLVVESANSWASSADEHIDKGMRLRDEYQGDPLITTHFAPHAPYSVSDETLTRVRRLADELELPVAIHLHETSEEIAHSLQRHGKRPLARLAGLGLASPMLVAVHMTQVAQEDIDTLAEAGASVVHCPESNLKLGSGVCPLPDLLDRGVRVGLGTDGAASNNDLDLLSEARTAGLLSSGVSAGPGRVAAGDLLRLATLEGARCLGLGDTTGSLVAGKWADMCCIDLSSPRSWPVSDIPTTLLYSASASQVTDTWVAGRHLLADGVLTYTDEADLLRRCDEWRKRMDSESRKAEEEPDAKR